MENTRKRLKQDYKNARRPMGVFLIRNIVNDKVFLGISLDLPSAINRHKFALNLGKHMNTKLQTDWNEFGSQNFAFEILDQLVPAANTAVDPRDDLQSLEDLWLEKLQPYADRGYNEPKLNREEKLRRIAANRNREQGE